MHIYINIVRFIEIYILQKNMINFTIKNILYQELFELFRVSTVI